MANAKSFILSFIKKEQVAKDTFLFYFDRSKASFDFFPGQYMYLTLSHENPDDRGTSRYFTISSSPTEKKYLMITTKVIESSFKKHLANLRPGTPVNFFGPMGWFLLPKDEPLEKVFLTGGIGITPFHSLLHSLAEQKLSKPITLFASFSKQEEVIFYDSLLEIAKNNKQIRVVYTLTNQKYIASDWSGEVGRISSELLKKYVKNLKAAAFYIVGSAKMVEETKKSLVDGGIAEENIQLEDFTGY
ncbi:MAG TPA: FAD-dependent oxidoreductase [Methylomirabilota bacterium]|nr:FAD-dependent oxidoreductase [Methylomirabilota bacterium]